MYYLFNKMLFSIGVNIILVCIFVSCITFPHVDMSPSESCHGRFYATAKVTKICENDTVDELPIQLIILNIGTGTFDLAKYLGKLLSPLSQSECIIKSTK